MKKFIFAFAFVLMSLTTNAQYYSPCGFRGEYARQRVSKTEMRTQVRVSTRPNQVTNITNNYYCCGGHHCQGSHMYYEPQRPMEPEYSPSDMWTQTVWFREAKTAVNTDDQRVTIDNVAKFIIQNPDLQFEIVGYASRRRGNYAHNRQLAWDRVESVMRILDERYRIPQGTIKQRVEGTDSQAYTEEDSWNQCVTIRCLGSF